MPPYMHFTLRWRAELPITLGCLFYFLSKIGNFLIVLYQFCYSTSKNACLQVHFCAVLQYTECVKRISGKAATLAKQGFLCSYYNAIVSYFCVENNFFICISILLLFLFFAGCILLYIFKQIIAKYKSI